MKVTIPATTLVVLIGVAASGKSTFASTHFDTFEVLSSDFCRALLTGNPLDQSVSADAFDILGYIAGKRLAANRLTVVDATNVTAAARRQWIALAKEHDVMATAIVLDVPVPEARARDAARDHPVGPRVIERQAGDLRRGIKKLRQEGFRRVHILRAEEVAEVEIIREPLLNDRREICGPFDLIGDVHGCLGELESLLGELGYTIERDEQGRAIDAYHGKRKAIFVGDLVDRGPDTPGVLRLVMWMVEADHALCVAGNHEAKLERALTGRKVNPSHGLAETLEQLSQEETGFAPPLVHLSASSTGLPLPGRLLHCSAWPQFADSAPSHQSHVRPPGSEPLRPRSRHLLLLRRRDDTAHPAGLELSETRAVLRYPTRAIRH